MHSLKVVLRWTSPTSGKIAPPIAVIRKLASSARAWHSSRSSGNRPGSPARHCPGSVARQPLTASARSPSRHARLLVIILLVLLVLVVGRLGGLGVAPLLLRERRRDRGAAVTAQDIGVGHVWAPSCRRVRRAAPAPPSRPRAARRRPRAGLSARAARPLRRSAPPPRARAPPLPRASPPRRAARRAPRPRGAPARRAAPSRIRRTPCSCS